MREVPRARQAGRIYCLRSVELQKALLRLRRTDLGVSVENGGWIRLIIIPVKPDNAASRFPRDRRLSKRLPGRRVGHTRLREDGAKVSGSGGTVTSCAGKDHDGFHCVCGAANIDQRNGFDRI
jgi:hypothetical protein